MDALYLKNNVYTALTEALASMAVALPDDKVEYLGKYLLKYVDRKKIKEEVDLSLQDILLREEEEILNNSIAQVWIISSTVIRKWWNYFLQTVCDWNLGVSNHLFYILGYFAQPRYVRTFSPCSNICWIWSSTYIPIDIEPTTTFPQEAEAASKKRDIDNYLTAQKTEQIKFAQVNAGINESLVEILRTIEELDIAGTFNIS